MGQELSLEEHHKRQVEVQTQFGPRKHIDQSVGKIRGEPIFGYTHECHNNLVFQSIHIMIYSIKGFTEIQKYTSTRTFLTINCMLNQVMLDA